MALERMPHDVQSHMPAYVLVQFGLNDCNYWMTDRSMPRVSVDAFRANLAEILDRCTAFGAPAVFLSTNHPTPRTEPFSHCDVVYQRSNERYNEVIRDLAARHVSDRDVVLIDHEAVWTDELKRGASLSQLLLEDGIHLSVEGHELYFKTVVPAIQPYFERER
jgi:lysophospholipase L1-like esterase